MRISHEAIYQALFVQGRGALRRELSACLRTGRALRVPRARVGARGKGFITDEVLIRERPAEADDRAIPGHWEGDLILGLDSSAIGTLVERTTGYLHLIHLPHGHTAEDVAAAMTAQLKAIPDWFAQTVTWDRGTEMTDHVKITEATGVQIYFADPYSPYQRGSNENINGLLREYFPKGTDLSVHTAADLQAVADQLNDRPRKRHDYATPREVMASLLEQDLARVATTD